MTLKTFTINDLERFSGVRAHTLRMWEYRYALLHPIRSSTNFRLYSLDELKKILDIALLNKNGCRISLLAQYPSSEIDSKIGSLSQDESKWQGAVNDLIINMYTLHPNSFERILDELLLKWTIDKLTEKILYPFLKITGLFWTGHKLYEEHLVVTAIRKKLILAIETTRVTPEEIKPIILFLPDGKQIDLGLLYANYFFRKKGIPVIYLGIDVTIQNLKIIFHIHPPAFVFTYLPAHHSFRTHELMECINLYSPATKLVVAHYSSESHTSEIENFVQLDFDEALHYIEANSNVKSRI